MGKDNKPFGSSCKKLRAAGARSYTLCSRKLINATSSKKVLPRHKSDPTHRAAAAVALQHTTRLPGATTKADIPASMAERVGENTRVHFYHRTKLLWQNHLEMFNIFNNKCLIIPTTPLIHVFNNLCYTTNSPPPFFFALTPALMCLCRWLMSLKKRWQKVAQLLTIMAVTCSLNAGFTSSSSYAQTTPSCTHG